MSPRPRKPRKCGCPYRPANSFIYKPSGRPMRDLEEVHLCSDELEALRLCDVEKFTQEQAGDRMGVSRGTIQRLVESGRHKMVGAIVKGYALVIEELETSEKP